MSVYSSLVCIELVLCLAVVPTALQKLHKCVTKNTTELLQREGTQHTGEHHQHRGNRSARDMEAAKAHEGHHSP